MKSPVKKVAAIHDLSGYGRSSLTVVMPILSSMGIYVCPLPTAILSTNSSFPGFHFADMTEQIGPIVKHWKNLGLHFDGIYSGFLGSPTQTEIVKEVINDFSTQDSLIIVDPVLGDNGKLYEPFKRDMITGMKSLIRHAKIITPNLTEACFLLDEPYQTHLSIQEIKTYAVRLAAQGPDTVIITSAPNEGSDSAVIAYDANSRRFWKVGCSYLPAEYPGTGDTFTSVICGALLQGDSLPIALDRAVHFVSYGVRATFGYEHDTREGILQEKILRSLDTPVQISSYELMD
ncbi:MAG: pyridoxamine kinase [Bacteroidetes bacterium]|nr:MAG: pyridoxamine kinase [Bacteroidota bacterium]PIE88501.1 MAG: pyridoxamine kinase [Bacteroidota bacterium]